jgi:hypothetical protein
MSRARGAAGPGAPGEGFRLRRRGGLSVFEADLLAGIPSLRHAFSTRRGGSGGGRFAGLNFSFRQGDEAEHVRANWAALSRAFGIAPERFLTVRQVHGNRVWVIDGEEPAPVSGGGEAGEDAPQCDAIVTNRPGIAIGVKTADCVPVLIADPVRRVIAAVHAGWQGTALRIVEQVCAALEARFSCRREDLRAAIGPAIGPCCYEVDGRVREAMAGLSGLELIFSPRERPGRWRLDLALANRLQLRNAGVPASRVAAANLCTACRPDLFFSHRGSGGKTGRHFNFLLMDGTPGEGSG